jgi:UDP-glucose 4-epimerase
LKLFVKIIDIKLLYSQQIIFKGITLNILLTGANGFLGSHFMKSICINGALSLCGVVRSSNAGLPFRHAVINDISSTTDWSKILIDQHVVIHAAARVHIMKDDSSDLLAEYRAVNTEGTLHLARQAAAAGVKRFIFLSTIKVNGETTSNRRAFTATDMPAPMDPYGVSKAEAEEQLLVLGKTIGMEIVIIRSPLVYGEGVKANFASLMALVEKGFPLPFRAINKNKRSLVSVYNLVDLITVCIDHPKASNQVFLVSDDNDLSTFQMVDLMAKVQGKVNLSIPVPVWCFTLAGKLFGKADVVDRLTGSLQLNIEHTKTTLNWVPPYSVEHGFRCAAKSHN